MKNTTGGLIEKLNEKLEELKNKPKKEKTTTREKIKSYSDKELELFIRARLGQDPNTFNENDSRRENYNNRPEHLRFEFCINGSPKDYIHNQQILFMFEDCGMFDDYCVLTLKFWKGSYTLFYCKDYKIDFIESHKLQDSLGTVELIRHLLQRKF